MSASGMSKMDMSAMDEAHKDFMAGMMKDGTGYDEGDNEQRPRCGLCLRDDRASSGAIDMANVELKYGDNAKAKEMARKIIKAQRQEITEFKEWLKANAK